ncbi:EAL domain-containing protein [Psychrobium sp. MM17-31]|uniref:EAL domain-containing protein n=1 Tax=Psychrobium sp. MM17-31 TaxID=2917758 RepID=UPI001EF45515|nr:EAL domain-containing protein [Psychrobium sp. MM17-31]MCG7530055.1 EAL domain-containing protein [Psychrobium sp. MM17-31]
MSKNLTKVKIVGAIVCFLVLFFAINFWSDISQKILNRQKNSLIQELTIANAIQVENLLNGAVSSSKIIEAELKLHPNDLHDLSVLANVIVNKYPELDQIRLSPNNITTHVFPASASAKYVGKVIVSPFLQPNGSEQYNAFLSIPQIINGDYVVKSHIPVTINDEHWGYVTYHINLTTLFTKIQLNQLDTSQYSYQVVHQGTFNKSTVLAESESPLSKDYYSAAIRVPNNAWYLKLSANANSDNPLSIINLVFSIMLASVFTLIGFLGISEPSRLRNSMKRLIQRFEYQQLILNQVLDNVTDEVYISDRNGKVYLNSGNAKDNHHIPSNILLENIHKRSNDNCVFEPDSKTPIDPSQHPINRALFNNETIIKKVKLMPTNEPSYMMELRSQPIFDALYNKVGALCIGQRLESESEAPTPNTSRNVILDMLAHDKPLKSVFEHIISDTQNNLDDVVAAITLINTKTQQISDVISKDLPTFYVDSLLGMKVEDRVMSNCSAIYHDKLTIVEDIEVHPFWVDYKELARQAKFRSCWSQPIHDTNNNVLGTLDIYSAKVNQTAPADIMILKEAAILCSLTLERHRDSHRLQKMSLAVQHSSNAVIITDSAGIIEYINPHYTKVTGYAPVEKLGTLIPVFDHNITPSHIVNDINQHLAVSNKWQGELKGQTKKRGDYWAMVSVTPILGPDQRINHLVFVLEDITQINQSVSRIDYHNSHDPLTNLYNRQAFEHRLQFLFTRAQEDVRTHALCAINIDQYNYLDQQYGYQASDELLRQVSQILSQQLRRRDTLARLGSDQFVVLMEDCDSTSAMGTAKELTARMEGFKFDWGNQSFDISLSVGISEVTSQSESPVQVCRQADMACNKVKTLPNQTVLIFQESGEAMPLSGDMFWAEQIKLALKEQQFLLYVQPIVAINQSVSQRYEVLLRLRDSKGNLVNPDIFLPAAARYNLSLAIDKWVIEQTLIWCQNNPESMANIEKISINLSSDALTDESFTFYLIELSALYPELFNTLMFEFSEYHLLSNIAHSKRFIEALSHTGCEFSIDNFGRGLSSFSHLRELPVSNIKIDGELIKSLISDPIAGATLQSILHLSEALAIDIVATNVENDRIANKLRDYNINYAQGFLLGEPFLLTTMRKQ